MTDPKAVASALALNDYFVTGVGSCPEITLAETVMTLAARVRELEADLTTERGKRCETCKHQLAEWRPGDPGCGLTRMTVGVHPIAVIVPCRFFGGGCQAWEAR
jgi:hypothetical protein